MTKKFANGDSMKLAVDGAAYARSAHRESGCIGCHSQIKVADHPEKVRNFASSRQYALAQNEACRSCHGRLFKTYQASAHGILVRDGNVAAPLCADCHQPHQVMPASARNNSRDACLNCHGDAEELHGKWLPNAARHLEGVACAACHAPDALRKVDLRIYAGGEPLGDPNGKLDFARRARVADANHDGLDASELRVLLTDLERGGAEVSLRGYLELRSAVDAHELPPKARALRDCVKCHDEKAAPFQSVTVSSLDADGRPVRYDAHQAILSSAITWEVLRGFYAIGGTRMKLLDVLLALGLLGGITVPALHILVRRMFRRRNDDGASK